MDIIPFSLAPPLMVPVAHTGGAGALADLRRALTNEKPGTIEEYIGALVSAQQIASGVWPGATPLTWHVRDGNAVVSRSIEMEITFALSMLASTHALCAEKEALDGKYMDAITSFCNTSQVLLLLGAFVERSATAQWPDAFRHAAIEARGRAALMKIHAQQVHFASLARTNDRDWAGAGRALVARYHELASGEFAKVLFIARAAEGLAHYWRAFSAHKELRLQKGALNIESTTNSADVDLLYANERLCDTVVYEGGKVLDVLSKVPAVKSQCEKWVARCRAKAATLRELRFKQMLLFSISNADMEARMATALAALPLEASKGFTTPPDVPVSLNPVWTRLLAIAASWTPRLSRGTLERLPVVVVPYSADLLTASPRSLDKVEQALVAASRLEERIAWMQGSKDALVHPQEIVTARETCDRLWTVYEKLKRLKQTVPN